MSILFLLLSFFLVQGNVWSKDLHIKIDNVKNNSGEILYLVFSRSEGFPDNEKNSIRQGKISTEEASSEGLVIRGLAEGQYAISLFHDENSNGLLDTNFLGLPKEGFGFSKNPKIYFGPPSFDRSRFELSNSRQIKINLIYF